MNQVLALADMQKSPTAWLFEGAGRGADLSFFVTRTPPGRGASLHVHPYPEVFLVQEGESTFRVGDEEIVVTGGHVLVVPPETPHGYTNTGSSPLHQVSIHPSPEVIQTWLEED